MWGYLFIIILLFVSGYLLYSLYKKYSLDKTNDFIENNEYKENVKKYNGEILFFYATWCPHSMKVFDKLDLIEKHYEQGNYKLEFKKIDCDEYSDMADSYNIEEYPTIVLLYNNEKYIYDAELDEKTFHKFIYTIMK